MVVAAAYNTLFILTRDTLRWFPMDIATAIIVLITDLAIFVSKFKHWPGFWRTLTMFSHSIYLFYYLMGQLEKEYDFNELMGNTTTCIDMSSIALYIWKSQDLDFSNMVNQLFFRHKERDNYDGQPNNTEIDFGGNAHRGNTNNLGYLNQRANHYPPPSPPGPPSAPEYMTNNLRTEYPERSPIAVRKSQARQGTYNNEINPYIRNSNGQNKPRQLPPREDEEFNKMVNKMIQSQVEVFGQASPQFPPPSQRRNRITQSRMEQPQERSKSPINELETYKSHVRPNVTEFSSPFTIGSKTQNDESGVKARVPLNHQYTTNNEASDPSKVYFKKNKGSSTNLTSHENNSFQINRIDPNESKTNPTTLRDFTTRNSDSIRRGTLNPNYLNACEASQNSDFKSRSSTRISGITDDNKENKPVN